MLKTSRACYTMYNYVLESKKTSPSKVKSPPSNCTIKRSHLKQISQVGLLIASWPSSRPKGGTILIYRGCPLPHNVNHSSLKSVKVEGKRKGWTKDEEVVSKCNKEGYTTEPKSTVSMANCSHMCEDKEGISTVIVALHHNHTYLIGWARKVGL